MSLLLALTGGGAPTSLSESISWTHQDSVWNVNVTASLNASVVWTQADATWGATEVGKLTSSASWTAESSAWAVTESSNISAGVSIAQQDAVWAVTANIVGASDNVAIAWTQQDANWSSHAKIIDNHDGGWNYKAKPMRLKKRSNRIKELLSDAIDESTGVKPVQVKYLESNEESVNAWLDKQEVAVSEIIANKYLDDEDEELLLMLL